MKVTVNRDHRQVGLHLLSNLVVLALMGGDLWCGQAQNGVNLAFQVKFDLEGQGQSTPQNNSGFNQVVLHFIFQIWWF